MNVDRARFLLLTVALAAAPAVAVACTVNNSTTNNGGGSDASVDGGGDDSAKGDAPGDVATDGNDGGGGCDDTKADGGAASCSSFGPDAAIDGGCGLDDRMPGFCDKLEANLKTKLANDAVECLAFSSACEGLGDCVAAALASACADPAAAQVCTNVLAQCGDAGVETGVDGGSFQTVCEATMSGLTQAGRAVMTDCYVNQTGCTDFPACAAALGN